MPALSCQLQRMPSSVPVTPPIPVSMASIPVSSRQSSRIQYITPVDVRSNTSSRVSEHKLNNTANKACQVMNPCTSVTFFQLLLSPGSCTLLEPFVILILFTICNAFPILPFVIKESRFGSWWATCKVGAFSLYASPHRELSKLPVYLNNSEQENSSFHRILVESRNHRAGNCLRVGRNSHRFLLDVCLYEEH